MTSGSYRDENIAFGETTVSHVASDRVDRVFSRDLSFPTAIRTPSKPNVATGSIPILSTRTAAD